MTWMKTMARGQVLSGKDCNLYDNPLYCKNVRGMSWEYPVFLSSLIILPTYKKSLSLETFAKPQTSFFIIFFTNSILICFSTLLKETQVLVQVLLSRLTFFGCKEGSKSLISGLQKYKETAEAVMCVLLPSSPTATTSRTESNLLRISYKTCIIIFSDLSLSSIFLASVFKVNGGLMPFICKKNITKYSSQLLGFEIFHYVLLAEIWNQKFDEFNKQWFYLVLPLLFHLFLIPGNI